MQNIVTQEGSPQSKWIVLKFGGSSVGEVKHWKTIATQVELNLSKGLRPFLVLSALKNVSNLLEALLHQALAGVHSNAIEHLKQQHLNFSAQLGLDIYEQLSPWFIQLEQDCVQIFQSKKISPKLHASILSVGELLSSTIGAEYLKNYFQDTTGENYWLDARLILTAKKLNGVTDDQWHHYTSAECDYHSDVGLLKCLKDKLSPVLVTQGFIASDSSRNTVLLGREGSDTSASYFGALLKAIEIQIWTDVPGVFSCNPQENNRALQLLGLSYSEAKQMAKSGAKVLHPRAIQPACDYSIPLLVKSTHLPMEKGTKVDKTQFLSPKIKAVVNEPKVIAIHYPENFEGLFRAAHYRVQSMGYDLVLKQLDETKQQTIIYRYNNSDKAEPSVQNLFDVIKQEMKANQVVLSTNLSLLSVIGSNNDLKWQQEVIDFCSSKIMSQKAGLLIDSQQGQVSLLVANEQLQQWDKSLHKAFIENNASEFGKPWLSFL